MLTKFSLVYWIKSKNIQTLESNKIPAASRYEGATVRLKFQDDKNKQYLDAKIIRMSNDDKELNELEVDEETGEIIDRSQKAFTKKILASRVLTATSTNSLRHSDSYFQNQPINHSNSHFYNQSMNQSTASSTYSNPYIYNQPQHAFTGYRDGLQSSEHQQNYFSSNQSQLHHHQQNVNQNYPNF